jgi:hypothetical protein
MHDCCYEDRIVDHFELLIEAGRCDTPRDAAAVAETLGLKDESWIVRFLQDPETGELPVDLILKELRVRAERECDRRFREIGSYAPGRRIGLLLPLPPHVLKYFIRIAAGNAVMLSADGHRPPPHLRWMTAVPIISGFRAVRLELRSFEMLVGELIKPNGEWLGNPTAVDLLDDTLVAATARIFVHMRPHEHDDDAAINPNIVPRLETL